MRSWPCSRCCSIITNRSPWRTRSAHRAPVLPVRRVPPCGHGGARRGALRRWISWLEASEISATSSIGWVSVSFAQSCTACSTAWSQVSVGHGCRTGVVVHVALSDLPARRSAHARCRWGQRSGRCWRAARSVDPRRAGRTCRPRRSRSCALSPIATTSPAGSLDDPGEMIQGVLYPPCRPHRGRSSCPDRQSAATCSTQAMSASILKVLSGNRRDHRSRGARSSAIETATPNV